MQNNDLISRAAAINAVNAYDYRGISLRDVRTVTDGCSDEIRRLPVIDAEPVRHGRWEFLGMDMMAGSRAFYFGTCSECLERINFEAAHKNYCPNCGAKMDLEVQDD